MKTAMSGLLAALLAAAVPALADPGDRERGINQRQHNQQHRIERHDGDRRFSHNERHPNLDQRLHHAVRNGDMTPQQARRVWNGYHPGYPGPASVREFDRRVDQIEHYQRERIAQGIRSGELTRQEARRLIAEQRAIEAEERRYMADGVLTQWERMDLMRDLNAASRHIYNETHDAQTRR